MSASRRDRTIHPRPARRLRHDERAVSEVIGQILALGITSTLLIATLWGFAAAKDNATERAVIVQGDAMLQRISATAVQAALFAEQHQDTGVRYEGRLELPHDLEGHRYTIDLDPDEVFLIFPDFGRSVSAPLFRAGSGTGVTVCDLEPIPGGPIRFILRPDNDPDVPDVCKGTGNALALYLEIDS